MSLVASGFSVCCCFSDLDIGCNDSWCGTVLV